MNTKPTINHTVLYADDDQDDRSIMREVLTLLESDHTLVEVSNGKEILDHLSSLSGPQQYPCLIVLDNNMPLMSGRETLITIRKEPKYSDIPVVIFSTSISQQDQRFFQSLGAHCYTKPSTMGAFKKLLAELLNHCGSEEKKAA